MNNEQTVSDVTSFYAVCRKIAKLTQEQTLPFLGIEDVSTLSRYEQLKVKPPRAIVAKMVTLYRNPELMSWHIRQWYPEFAPYIIEPTKITSNETLQSSVVRSQTILSDLEKTLNIFLMDDELDEDETFELLNKKPLLDLAVQKMVAVRNHISNLADSRETLIVKKVEKKAK